MRTGGGERRVPAEPGPLPVPRVRARAALALVLLVSACGGGDADGDARGGSAAAPAAVAAEATRADREPGRVLVRFVRGARRGDAAAMWSLLTAETRATHGGTLAVFRAGTARDLERGAGTMEGGRVILSRVVGGTRWGVAAVAGARTVDGVREAFAYGAALRRERRGWRLDLGGLVVDGLSPEPHDETDARPLVAATVNAPQPPRHVVVWLDGRLLPFELARTTFRAHLEATPRMALRPGRHHVVAFAATDDAAAAVAWPFFVGG